MTSNEGSDAVFAEEIDSKVEKFTKEICQWIFDRFPEKYSEVEVDEELVDNSLGTLKARKISIRSDLGMLIVLPNFTPGDNTPAGMVINLGLARAMMLEGFDLEYIEREGRIYSDPIPYSNSAVEVLGYYLTHKVTTSL